MYKIPGIDHCILGIAESADGIFRLCYSQEMILDHLVVSHKIDYDEAQEFFDTYFLDIKGAITSPIFVTQMDIEDIERMAWEANQALPPSKN